MKVIKITPRGFCPGVVSAIKIVNDAISDPSIPRPIQILGMIVHNHYVVDDFTSKGVITLDKTMASRHELLQMVKSGTVIITAHGVSDDIFDSLIKKNIHVIDATCKDVLRTKNLVLEQLSKNAEVIYIGKKNHPETEGVISLSSHIYLVESLEDVAQLPYFKEDVFITNQTTFSLRDIDSITKALLERFPEATVADEICDSTRLRQEAIIEQNKDVDLCFIVGDPRSNNTRNLAKISAETTHTKTIQIESVDDIVEEMLVGVKTVSVSSGASTPTYITKQVIAYLENHQ
ncbi:MAG: 4-hydroxy-3-methylbut-2-enyl diphosphate reductase [Candidatus Izemoplasmatales bacterium]